MSEELNKNLDETGLPKEDNVEGPTDNSPTMQETLDYWKYRSTQSEGSVESQKADYILFKAYLDIFGTEKARALAELLGAQEDDDKITIKVPLQWVDDFTEAYVTKYSKLASEVKTRSTSTDRILQPNLASTETYHGTRNPPAPEVKWPNEPDVSGKIYGGTTVEDQYTTIVVMMKPVEVEFTDSTVNTNNGNYNNEVLAFTAESFGLQFDYDILRSEFDDEKAIKGIPGTESVFGHASGGMKTIGGYIDGSAVHLDELDGNVFKGALFHLPQGYRQRSKWIMNEGVARALLDMKDINGNYMIGGQDREAIVNGLPTRLLNKPIIISDGMPSEGIIAFIADLTRGYIASKKPNNMKLVIYKATGKASIVFDFGGQVLQPASFKGVRFTPKTREEALAERDALVETLVERIHKQDLNKEVVDAIVELWTKANENDNSQT